MGLSNALNIANSGLRVTQSSVEVVARNVANADTPGYTTKRSTQENLVSAGRSLGVRVAGVTRSVDAYLQNQIRLESATAGHIAIRSEVLQRVDTMFGQPGGVNALDTIINDFAGTLQQLTTSPEAYENRQAVISNAQILAQNIRELSGEVQALRQYAEDSIADAVNDINGILEKLSEINAQLAVDRTTNVQNGDLLDERDRFLSDLSQYLEIHALESEDGRVTVFTRNGNVLLENQPVQFEFDAQGHVTAETAYSTDPAERNVGTIIVRAANGYQVDLIEHGLLETGRLGGLIELRDEILVQTQGQLDELAAGLALAMSNRQVEGSAVTAGAQEGFDLDVTGLLPGNSITLNYVESGTAKTLTVIRVDDPTQLPLDNSATANPDDTVLGVDFSGGIAAAAAAIDAALGAGVTASAPGGNILRFLDDGAAATTDITSATASITVSTTQDDGVEVPLFIDSGSATALYTGSFDGGDQKVGFASRIAVNRSILANNELLVRYSSLPETPIGDPTRPLALLERLDNQTIAFSPQSGIGNSGRPYVGTVTGFATQIVSFQAGQAARTARENDAQNVIVTALVDKFEDQTGVDVDQELTDLITLQNAYAANARILQVVQEMTQLIFQR